MTDLLQILPDFAIQDFSNILPSLEKHKVTLADILTCDVADVAKRAQVPAREVRRLSNSITHALHGQLGVREDALNEDDRPVDSGASFNSGNNLVDQWRTISVLDDDLDAALGGGIPAGYLTELTGESGAGKTQLLLTLLLAVQLPQPLGLARSALYISTEAPLSTSRLSQLLSGHPRLRDLSSTDKPSLSKVLALQTPDLESQEHIIRYQLPVAIARYNVGLVVIDSITANYRAEFDVPSTRNQASGASKKRLGPISMARRSAQLTELGRPLRDLARTHNIAVVVANQVSDRFQSDATKELVASTAQAYLPSSNPAAGEVVRAQNAQQRAYDPPASEPTPGSGMGGRHLRPGDYDPMTLDHQQRFFTGWGASPSPAYTIGTSLKTPSLGLVWTNQIACRIALIKTPLRGRVAVGRERMLWKRHLKVVFAPWVKGEDGSRGVEFLIEKTGVQSAASRHRTEKTLEQ